MRSTTCRYHKPVLFKFCNHAWHSKGLHDSPLDALERMFALLYLTVRKCEKAVAS